MREYKGFTMVAHKHESRAVSTAKEETEKEQKPAVSRNSTNRGQRNQSQLGYKPAAWVFLFCFLFVLLNRNTKWREIMIKNSTIWGMFSSAS